VIREALDRFGAEVCQPGPAPRGAAEAAAPEAERTTVVLPAGGFGYRMRGAAGSETTQKCLLPLPSGETLIGRLIREYRGAGFRRFVALLNHEGLAVEEHLDGGRPWGVQIGCSYDPEPEGSGRTGAIKRAAAAGVLDPGGRILVHNADCPTLRYPGSFGLDLLRTHLDAAAGADALATLVAVAGTPYPYTGMSIHGGRVTGIEMYPYIPLPTHAGITVLEGEAVGDLIDSAPPGKSNFEREMFPRWAAAGRLAAMVIRADQWIAVDDRKAYRQLCEYVASEGSP